jgi:hypothetical protein
VKKDPHPASTGLAQGKDAADHNHSCGLSLFIDAFIGINTNVLKIDRIVLVGSICFPKE